MPFCPTKLLLLATGTQSFVFLFFIMCCLIPKIRGLWCTWKPAWPNEKWSTALARLMKRGLPSIPCSSLYFYCATRMNNAFPANKCTWAPGAQDQQAVHCDTTPPRQTMATGQGNKAKSTRPLLSTGNFNSNARGTVDRWTSHLSHASKNAWRFIIDPSNFVIDN